MRRVSAMTPLDPQIVKAIDVDHSLTGLVGELLKLPSRITDRDVDGPFRIEHSVLEGAPWCTVLSAMRSVASIWASICTSPTGRAAAIALRIDM
jgi:hypothetical protein